MANPEINKELVEWAFPKAESIIVESGISIYHSVEKHPEYPYHIELLTKSLDACFKWLIPKGRKKM